MIIVTIDVTVAHIIAQSGDIKIKPHEFWNLGAGTCYIADWGRAAKYAYNLCFRPVIT
jgi:hypothetical protein